MKKYTVSALPSPHCLYPTLGFLEQEGFAYYTMQLVKGSDPAQVPIAILECDRREVIAFELGFRDPDVHRSEELVP